MLAEIDPATQLIVNTTPVGLSPNVGSASPYRRGPFLIACAVFDLLSNPQTRLIASRASRLRAVNGWNMLVYQALRRLKWIGHSRRRGDEAKQRAEQERRKVNVLDS
jgi:shikimate 5-dehydrogenase